jgi:hypothetical protein
MSSLDQEKQEYRSKSILNQKGAAVDINNSTDREEIKISQYSGSNISLNNLVNNELATNNKQVKVINDSFTSVGKNKSVFTGKDSIERVQENTYSLKGFVDDSNLEAAENWKNTYKPAADDNALFQIKRTVPGGGSRGDNSTKEEKYTPTNSKKNGGGDVTGYAGSAIVDSDTDEVTSFSKPIFTPDTPPETTSPENEDIDSGNVTYPEGADKNSATEGGDWSSEKKHEDLDDTIKDLQEKLNVIEDKLGNGGDEIEFIKRGKTQTVGAAFNDYQSVRVDTVGRSQPQEVVVGPNLTFVNVGSVPHVEDVDNSMNFPVGNYTLTVGNRYNVLVGSGGLQLKSTGSVEVVGTHTKVLGGKVDISAKYGVSITSPENIEISSAGNSGAGINIRSNKQVFIEPGLGVKNNITTSGSLYVAGEIYTHHITAPCEVQQTEFTTLFGKFNTDEPRKLKIGECEIGGSFFPVYADPTDNLILNYPHSHNFNNLPLRLMKDHKGLRDKAISEGINRNGYSTQSREVVNEKKVPQ